MRLGRELLKAAVAVGSLNAGFVSTAAAETYEYDALGRLTKVTFDDGSTITYTYDANGNRVTVVGDKP